MDKITVALVDDHALFRNGLGTLLSNCPEFSVVIEASNGQEYLDKLASVQPDITLMDINMPVMDGITASQNALSLYPNLKIIALSMYDEDDYYYKLISAGVKGALLKDTEISEVVKSIHEVIDGKIIFSQEQLINVINNHPHKEVEEDKPELSRRELEVLQEICKGLSNQEIADELFISKRTVDKHRGNLLSKTGSRNTANLIMYAIKHNLVRGM
ncbi:MAG: response regulator transcription factor [Salinivirgaceae bacterium]|nr:response regulator transcription factor [Salinivirgaceae bacterium]